MIIQPSGGKRFSLPYVFLCFLFALLFHGEESKSQNFWTETFGTTAINACDQGSLALGFGTANGIWMVTDVGTQDTAANEWYISAAEPGLSAGNCAGTGCFSNTSARNRTLHIGNVSNSPNALTVCPTGDCGAYYDPGVALQNSVFTFKRAESPAINCTGQAGITLSFIYYLGKDASGIDNGTIEYFDGTSWSVADNPPATDTSCGLTGHWTRRSVVLPISASNNPAVKIGFTWKNNNGGGGPVSFAVDSISLTSTIPPIANFTVSDTTLCAGDCISFRDTSLNAPAHYSWSFPGASRISDTTANPSGICYAVPGSYDVQLIVSNVSGSDTLYKAGLITVSSCAAPVAYFTTDSTSFCERSCRTFTDSSTNVPTAWAWHFPGAIPDTSNSQHPTNICYFTPGTYHVTLVVYNQYGSDTLVKTNYVTVNTCPLPVADFFASSTEICSNRCINFADLTTHYPVSWSWYFPGATPDTSTSKTPSNICYATDGLYDVQLIASNQYGSDTIIKYSYIKVESVPSAFVSQDTAMYFGNSYQLNAGGGLTYTWSPSTGLDTNYVPDPIATPLSTITYTVSITDTAGCRATRQVTVTILHDNNTFVPNSFSPNGDGANDVLYVRGNNLYGIRFAVFDRWGEKVFETTNQQDGWNGKYKGKDLDPAVFTYVLTVNFDDGKSRTETGTVTLVR